MKTKLFLVIVTCLVVTSVFSQSNLNQYKYVIVPDAYNFLKTANQYQLNSLTQFLFNKYGFEAFIEGTDYPKDLIRNRCLALRSNVLKGSGVFKTKLTIELKDCNGQVVYTSAIGESRNKEYDKAYNQALRGAFKSFENLNYSYKPSENITSLASNAIPANNEVSKEIKQLKEEIKSLKKEKVQAVKEAPKVIAVKKKTKALNEALPGIEEHVIEGDSNVLYAQEIKNGFQLVDSSPKVVYRILETGANNVFLVESKSAIIYKNGDYWILEYYSNNTLKQETLNIKF